MRKWVLGICFLLSLGFNVSWSQPVSASTRPSVLLVYDSKVVPEQKAARITQMQQLLLAAGLKVHTQSLASYQAGELEAYQGVVTMINWDDEHLTNTDFTQDRAKFQGATLHVGGNLQADELKALQAQATPLYRRQLVATWPNTAGTQLLPYTTPVWVLTHTPKSAIKLGSLAIQGCAQTYPYATIVDHHAYLPYFDGKGQSELAGAEVVSRLFGGQSLQAPMFLLTNVTPYSNLKLLTKVADDLADHNIGFAVSATSVARNTELSAFGSYTKALRSVMADGGVIFLQTPAVGNGLVGTTTLQKDMTSTLTALAQRHVFPVGISSPTYWRDDRLYRKQALSGADTAVLLPNPKSQTFAQEDDQATPQSLTFATVSAESLMSTRYGVSLSSAQINTNLPLAVTFAMPNSKTAFGDFKKHVQAFDQMWRDPKTLTTSYQVGLLDLAYKNGLYEVNGRQATGSYHTPSALRLEKTPQSWMNKFFAGQSKVMWGFFAITTIVMVIMLVLGRQVYLRMYKRR